MSLGIPCWSCGWDCKEVQPIHPKGDQSWVFIGRTDAKAETPILWPPNGKSWLIGKDPDAGRDWWQEEKGTTEDEMAGWHHRLDGGLACCDSWGRKESDTTERPNWTEKLTRSLCFPNVLIRKKKNNQLITMFFCTFFSLLSPPAACCLKSKESSI